MTTTPAPTGVDLLAYASAGHVDGVAVIIFVYVAVTTLGLAVFASLYAAVKTAPGASEAAQKRASARASKRASARAASEKAAGDKAKLLADAPGHVRGAVVVGTHPAERGQAVGKQLKHARGSMPMVVAPASLAVAVASPPPDKIDPPKAAPTPTPASFAFADPLLLLFLLQGISLTGRLSALPRSYKDDVAGAFGWATLDVRVPAWGRSLASLAWAGALAEPDDDDDDESGGERASVAALRAQVFYLALSLVVALVAHVAGRLVLWGAAFAPPVFLQRGHVELTAMLSVGAAVAAGAVPVLFDFGGDGGGGDGVPLAWRLVAGGECCLILAVVGLLMQRTISFQAYWVPEANLRRLRVLDDLFPVEKGDGAAEGLGVEDVAAAAPDLGISRNRSQIIFYELDTRTRGRVDRDAFLAAVAEEDKRSVAFGEATWLEGGWALFCLGSRRAGSWAPTNEKLEAKASNFVSSLHGFLQPSSLGFARASAPARAAARRKSEFEARVGLQAARAAGLHIAERGVGGFWGRYITPFCPSHKMYYTNQLWRLGVEVVLLWLLRAQPAWQAGACLLVEAAACFLVCAQAPCVLLAQTRVEVVGSLARVAVYALAWTAHVTAALAWCPFQLSAPTACGWMALLHLLALLHACATYLAPMARPTYVFLFRTHGPPFVAFLVVGLGAAWVVAKHGASAGRRGARWVGDGVQKHAPGAKASVDKCAAPMGRALKACGASCWRHAPPASDVRRVVSGVCVKVWALVGAVAVCPFLACFLCLREPFRRKSLKDKLARDLLKAEKEAAEAEEARRAAALAAFTASEEASKRRAADEAALKARLKAESKAKRDEYDAAEQRRFLAREEERLAKHASDTARGLKAKRDSAARLEEAKEAEARRIAFEREVLAAEEEFRRVAAAAFAKEEARRFAALEEARARKAAESTLEAEYREVVRKQRAAEAAASVAKQQQVAARAAEVEAIKARMQAAIAARREEYESAEARRFVAREEERAAAYKKGVDAERVAAKQAQEAKEDAARKKAFEANEAKEAAAAAAERTKAEAARAASDAAAIKASEAAFEAEYKASKERQRVTEFEARLAADEVAMVALEEARLAQKAAARSKVLSLKALAEAQAAEEATRAKLRADAEAAEAKALAANARLKYAKQMSSLHEDKDVDAEKKKDAVEMVDLEAAKDKDAKPLVKTDAMPARPSVQPPHGGRMVDDGPSSHKRRARAVTEAIGGLLLFEPGARVLGRAGSWMGGKIDNWGDRRRTRRLKREAAKAEGEEAALAEAKAKWTNRRSSFIAGRTVLGLPAQVAAAWTAEERADAAETGSANEITAANTAANRASGSKAIKAMAAKTSNRAAEAQKRGSKEGSKAAAQRKEKASAKSKIAQVSRGKSPIHGKTSGSSNGGSDSRFSGSPTGFATLSGLEAVPASARGPGKRLGTSLDDVTTGKGGGGKPSGGVKQPSMSHATRKAQSADSVLGAKL